MEAQELAEITLFDGLPDAQLERIAGWLSVIEVPERWQLVNQGSFAHEFFVILDGTVAVERADERVATLRAGDFFGEIGLLEDDRRTANVVTLTPVRAAVMDAPDFYEMCAEIPLVAQRITTAAILRGER